MVTKSTRSQKNKESVETAKLTRAQRLSLFFFHRPRKTALLWLIITLFGVLCYTTFLKREGFPAINTPFAIGQGAYLVNDPAKVDSDIGKPLSDFLLKQDGVKTVQTQSAPDFYTAIVTYNDNVNAETRTPELSKQIQDKKLLPPQATLKFEPFRFGFTQRGDDMVVSFYASGNNVDTKALTEKAKKAAEFLKAQNLSLVQDVSIIDPYEKALNPVTGQEEEAQKSFDRFGKRENDANNFYKSVVIGVNAKDKVDNLALDDEMQAAVTKLNSDPEFKGYHGEISASFAPQIKEQVNELQRALLEGLIAVLVIGSIVIAIRASLITVIAMATVIATVNGLLLLFGYSLNTITLFALILGLSLIVDDTIIMVKALDAQRKKQKKADDAVKVATRRVSRAMIAATTTAALSFAPLLFVGGILGSFIRAIPITIISALFISLFVALVFIPLFARFLLLGKDQMGEGHVKEVAAGIEARIASFISRPMLWAKNSRKKLVSVGIIAMIIGFGFIGAGGVLFQKVTFNIFPPSKDSNGIITTLTFPPNTNIERAQEITDRADKIIGDTVGVNFEKASYYGQADIQKAMLTIDITNYNKRAIKAPEIIDQIKHNFADFKDATVDASQADVGPPAAAFTVRIDSSQNRAAALRLANDVAAYLKTAQLKRTDGSVAKIESVSVANPSIYTREGKPGEGNKQYLEVSAKFADTDTTTLVTLAQDAVKKEFPPDKVASYGLSKDAISFNIGQEQENQDSFKTLALAFPLLLVAIYVLLAFQFKSLLQPLLIFMAIPFSLFGITLGLYLTDNAFSFFAMLGFFALIGLSIKNTILLTDYANQERRAGLGAVDAAHEALKERFRPLIATSLTAVVALIPLAISSPFWEGLAVVLISGLLSSTFLVITVFPYYYLGSEFLRTRINRRTGLLWIVISASLTLLLIKVPAARVLAGPVMAALFISALKKRRRKA
jgi:multidrug efflux pump subunit AcrB